MCISCYTNQKRRSFCGKKCFAIERHKEIFNKDTLRGKSFAGRQFREEKNCENLAINFCKWPIQSIPREINFSRFSQKVEVAWRNYRVFSFLVISFLEIFSNFDKRRMKNILVTFFVIWFELLKKTLLKNIKGTFFIILQLPIQFTSFSPI